MPTPEPRYWVYVHDQDGDLVHDLGDWNTASGALGAAAHWLFDQTDESTVMTSLTIRVVDRQADLTTVWLAGPTPVCTVAAHS